MSAGQRVRLLLVSVVMLACGLVMAAASLRQMG
jgi:hypothetical protein